MNIVSIELAEELAKRLDEDISILSKELRDRIEYIEAMNKDFLLLKTQIASARIDGKKEFDADTYMKGKKK